MARVIKTVTENYTVLDGDDGGIIIGNSSSPITITMPSAIGRATFSLTVMNASTGDVIVLGQTINQNEEISIANSNNIWIYALGGSGGGSSTLSGLSDVTIISPATNDILTYDGSKWIASPQSGGGGLSILDEELTLLMGGLSECSGTISISGNNVVGSGTFFTSETKAGESLWAVVGGEPIPVGEVESIYSNTELALKYYTMEDTGLQFFSTNAGDDSNDWADYSSFAGIKTFSKIDDIIASYNVFGKRASLSLVFLPRTYEFTDTGSFHLSNYKIPISAFGMSSSFTTPIVFENCEKIKIEEISSPLFHMINNSCVEFSSCQATLSQTPSFPAFNIISCNAVKVSNCYFSNDAYTIGIEADQSNVYLYGLDGEAVTYGMASINGSNIYKIEAPYPVGGTSNEFMETAGEIR